MTRKILINITMKSDSIYFQLILKELDTIQDIIKNLDNIIHLSKNFAFLVWGGSLYLIIQHLTVSELSKAYLVFATILIPLLFWMMDYKWRKHILQSSQRMKIISLFINSPKFEKFVNGISRKRTGVKFPLYDPVGWIFTKKNSDDQHNFTKFGFHPKYLRNESEIHTLRVLGYKDAYLFFGTLALLSLVLGIILLANTLEC